MKTLPISMPFLNSLAYFSDACSMRATLASVHPAFSSVKLPKLVVVGAAPEGARLIDLCRSQGVEVLAVCDSNPEKHGTNFSDYLVRPVAEALTWGADTPILIASHKPLAAVKELRTLGATTLAPFALLQVLHPRAFPPHMFYAGWFEDLYDNRTHYAALADLLAGDVLSLKTLDAIIGFRLTLDATLLESVIDTDAFLSRDLVSFRPDGTYIDGGAFDGDTVRKYIAAAGGRFGRIIAFEPDPETFVRLKANFVDEACIEPMNVGLHRRKGVMRFVNDSSRAALLSDVGEIDVPVIGIDEILNGALVSYIKLNIEGAELETLEGARESISHHHPVLAISAYHAPDHLWRVPELIRSIEPNYRLYLRQQDGGAVETVIYGILKD